MEFIDKETIARIVCGLQDDMSVLQLKVGALESLLLTDRGMRAKYTELVNEQAEALMRERRNKLASDLTSETPPEKIE